MTELDAFTPEHLDLPVKRGDSWWIRVTYAGDLTGYDVAGAVKADRYATETTPLQVVDLQPDTTASTFLVGQDIAVVGGLYDIQITRPDIPGARTLIEGNLYISEDVTP